MADNFFWVNWFQKTYFDNKSAINVMKTDAYHSRTKISIIRHHIVTIKVQIMS